MVSAHAQRQEEQLRKRLNKFLANRSQSRRPLRALLDQIRRAGWRAFIFGGTLRDLMINGAATVPRDVDIVVDGLSIEDLSHALAPHVKRRTRFGGLHLEIQGWLFDIWPTKEK